jgi:hypothetical protein
MEYRNFQHFTRNKYFKWYDNIIQKAINENREYDSCFFEKHHALPRCLGGSETVILTFKEHYICHWLLSKFTEGAARHKMIIAMSFFYYNKINTKAKRPLNANKSRSYENFKKTFVEAQKERYSDPTLNPFYKDNIFIFRKIDTKETFNYTRLEATQKTVLEPNEVSRLISRGVNRHLKSSSKGWDVFVEKKNVFSSDITPLSNKTMIRNNQICEHCGKKTNIGNYKRWHGDKCKIIRN